MTTPLGEKDALVPPSTQEHLLRAMATNYANGHSWDHLDGEACVKAADEIRSLRTALTPAAPEGKGRASQPVGVTVEEIEAAARVIEHYSFRIADARYYEPRMKIAGACVAYVLSLLKGSVQGELVQPRIADGGQGNEQSGQKLSVPIQSSDGGVEGHATASEGATYSKDQANQSASNSSYRTKGEDAPSGPRSESGIVAAGIKPGPSDQLTKEMFNAAAIEWTRQCHGYPYEGSIRSWETFFGALFKAAINARPIKPGPSDPTTATGDTGGEK